MKLDCSLCFFFEYCSVVDRINQLAELLARRVTASGQRIVTAESCTGGLVAARLTEIPGSSAWFEGAFVTYSLSAKRRMLGVPAATLQRYGAVSEPTARAMAEGAVHVADADLAVAITGIAGPEGGDPITPVGTVWFAWAARKDPGTDCDVVTAEHEIAGSRNEVRRGAVLLAIEGLLEMVEPQPASEG